MAQADELAFPDQPDVWAGGEPEEERQQRPGKRQKLYEDVQNNAGAWPSLSACSSSPALCIAAASLPAPAPAEPEPELLALPEGVLYHILCKLDSHSLNVLSQCCKHFWALDKAPGAPVPALRFTHKFAKAAVERMVGEAQAARWRHYNWLQRLRIEEVCTLFDRGRAEEKQFIFKEDAAKVVTEIRLESPGPRILVSDVSTAQSGLLRWKLVLRGNNAAEFGVIPAELEDTPKALHKCIPTPEGKERGVGFHSAITVGSLLPSRMPLMKGSIVEVLATPSQVDFIVTNPEDGNEMMWQNNSTVSRPYKGPPRLHLQIPYKYSGPIKLAVTAWHRAAFEVVHTQEQLKRHG